ncbi:MAG: DinB family protein [Chloroflexota bacterium]|jgi:uncharacterized damage-inducible protein DinB|nr:DinB family protein [Chloroflexota bacterium]
MKIIEPYVELLDDLFDRMDGLFSDLPDEALDWTPDPTMNSMTVLVVHVTGSLQYWVGEMLGGEPAHRDRSAEFQAENLSKEELHKKLDSALSQTKRVMEKVTMVDLEEKRYSTIHKDYFDGAFALMHALEHTARHVGHMEITRELWEQFDWGI